MTTEAIADGVRPLRRAAARFAAHHGVARTDEVEVAVSEACTNVILHAYGEGDTGPLHLSADRHDDHVRFVIADDGVGVAASPPGMGLGIMAALADRSHVDHRPGRGTRVRLDFAIRGAGGAAGPDVAGGGTERRRLLHQAREQIAEAVRGGATMPDIERSVIARQALSTDARDALWLYAWSRLERRQIQQWARAWRPHRMDIRRSR